MSPNRSWPTRYLWWIFLFSSICPTALFDNLCKKCDFEPSGSFLENFCKNHNSTGQLILSDSCCWNTTNIIGVDLSNCSLKEVDGFFTSFASLKVILLQDNKDLKIKPEDFQGLVHIEYLALPKSLQCPGGNNSWHEIKETETTVVCKDELNLCDRVSCPYENSYCSMIQPGSVECLCEEGYHGYKCLRQGYFPTVLYTVVLCSCTVVLSGYLWCIQRRKVKRH